jgi:hypothetical protein
MKPNFLNFNIWKLIKFRLFTQGYKWLYIVARVGFDK